MLIRTRVDFLFIPGQFPASHRFFVVAVATWGRLSISVLSLLSFLLSRVDQSSRGPGAWSPQEIRSSLPYFCPVRHYDADTVNVRDAFIQSAQTVGFTAKCCNSLTHEENDAQTEGFREKNCNVFPWIKQITKWMYLRYQLFKKLLTFFVGSFHFYPHFIVLILKATEGKLLEKPVLGSSVHVRSQTLKHGIRSPLQGVGFFQTWECVWEASP